MRRTVSATAGLMCVLLSACAAPPEQTSPDGAAAISAATGNETRAPSGSTADNSQTASRPAGPAPEKLVGMTTGDITSLFGNPVFVRRDPPAEFWRYRSQSCVLELYFYQRNGAWRVDHMEMRRGDQPVADQPGCISALQAQPRRS